MEYRVKVAFTDLQDGNRHYKVGDAYPRNGMIVSKERLEALSTTKNKRRMELIEKVEELQPEAAQEKATEEEPKKEKKATRTRRKAPKAEE